jgi:hypothetical protein
VIDTFLQSYIWATAVLALYFVTESAPRRQFIGCVIGLAGQPAWIWVTWQTGQLGMLCVSILYATFYGRGLFGHLKSGAHREGPALTSRDKAHLREIQDLLLSAARRLREHAAELHAAATIGGKWLSTDEVDRADEAEYEELHVLAGKLERMAK